MASVIRISSAREELRSHRKCLGEIADAWCAVREYCAFESVTHQPAMFTAVFSCVYGRLWLSTGELAAGHGFFGNSACSNGSGGYETYLIRC